MHDLSANIHDLSANIHDLSANIHDLSANIHDLSANVASSWDPRLKHSGVSASLLEVLVLREEHDTGRMYKYQRMQDGVTEAIQYFLDRLYTNRCAL